MNEIDVVVIGGGITGLTAAWNAARKGKSVIVLERESRFGGKICSYKENGFIFESGPNTGVISNPEVVELFESLNLPIAEARRESKKRLIWKGKKFHSLPSSMLGGVLTPLFTWRDKLRILREPWRKKGNNPNESLADLTRRRLGKSFFNYAVDPFISGVYAGDPERLITRYALPKLYRLEQDYGSFIRGAIQKARMPKTDRECLATKAVFSASDGLQSLINALTMAIGENALVNEVQKTHIQLLPTGGYCINYNKHGKNYQLFTSKVVSAVGAYALPELLPFITEEHKRKLNNLTYAPVVQVAIGYGKKLSSVPQAFGGLVPSKEQREILGVLIPSACFHGRTPQGGALLSVFMGGIRNPQVLDYSDEKIQTIVLKELQEMFHLPNSIKPDVFRIFRHQRAVPQYELNTGERLAAISEVEDSFQGLHIIGNSRDGIGLADRIKQAEHTMNAIFNQ
jgi:oxygen-dependent protoporphyrinogen oxidase